MKTRKKCEFNTKRFLDNKKNVIIDRCNFDEQQRAVWINIAKEYNVPIDCVVFTTTLKECAERIKVRENHPTGVTGDEGLKILQRFVSNYQPPTLTSKEGFDRIIFLDPSPTPTCTKERVDQVLQQLY
ncbi:AAA domain-containing protein [Pilobolus umbonatus]|nr:AAA domain-containing protein [Pilobolus umbonatus]